MNYYNEVDKLMAIKRKKQRNQGNKSLPEKLKYTQLLLYCHRISQSDRKINLRYMLKTYN